MDFVAAAAFPLTVLTAWHMLMTRAGLKRGEDVRRTLPRKSRG
jgi:NADPH:quinone reductase-like Zn-dependent oxidoreductase